MTSAVHEDTWVTKLERGRLKFAEKFPTEYAWMLYQAYCKYLPETWLIRRMDQLPASAQFVILEEVRSSIASYMGWTKQ